MVQQIVSCPFRRASARHLLELPVLVGVSGGMERASKQINKLPRCGCSMKAARSKQPNTPGNADVQESSRMTYVLGVAAVTWCVFVSSQWRGEPLCCA